MANQRYIFWLEGVDYLQVVRLNGLVDFHKVKENKVTLETKHVFYLLKDRFKIKEDFIMIVKEIKKRNIKGG